MDFLGRLFDMSWLVRKSDLPPPPLGAPSDAASLGQSRAPPAVGLDDEEVPVVDADAPAASSAEPSTASALRVFVAQHMSTGLCDEALEAVRRYTQSYAVERLTTADLVLLFPLFPCSADKVRLAETLSRGCHHCDTPYPALLLLDILSTIPEPIYKLEVLASMSSIVSVSEYADGLLALFPDCDRPSAQRIIASRPASES